MFLSIHVQPYLNLKRNYCCVLDPPKRSIFNIHDLVGIKLLTRPRVEFSDLHEHRFRHNFLCSSPFCSCQIGIEDKDHFLLHCPRFSSHRRHLLDLFSRSIDFDIISIPREGGYTSISLTGMLVREQISTNQKHRMTLNLTLKALGGCFPPPVRLLADNF